ncbi:unnamed protein product [Rhizoctonia solani]|uniref:Uncharacterized protein n=1 Tax=Rhizoctonia solani TaxID=456999 RepID=A0A8H3DW21_9AGAM|nr:unnamed protein product [Rhizoctonia solani]
MAGTNMVARLSIPVANTSRRLIRNRTFFSSSCAFVSPKTGSTANAPGPQNSVKSKARLSEPPDKDPPIPEIPGSKLLYRSGPTPRRPGVKPPPTLALPSSMLPPPPRIPFPTSPAQTVAEMSEAHAKTYDIYINSLTKRDEEPTLDDLDALRPPPSTIRAAYEGVIGSGRALLPADHPLHLAIEKLGAHEASVGGGPTAKKTVVAGTKKAKKLEYQALYAATEGMIARRFNAAQLRRFEKETKMQKPQKRVELLPEKATSKPRVIHRLMNLRWEMLHPKVVEEHMTNESRSIERSYHVSPSELFIFLGRDGEDLRHLSKELNMRINVDQQPPQPVVGPKEPPLDRSTTRPGFIIRASGAQSSHQKLRKYIEDQRDTMTVRVVELPTGPPLSSSVLESISRTAGAFVENLDSKFASLHDSESSTSSVSITAHNPRSAYTAERLVQRAAMETAHQAQLSLFVLLKYGKPPISSTDEEYDLEHRADRYALYPFGTQGFRARSVQKTSPASGPSPSNDVTQLPLTSGALDVQNHDKDEAFILTGEELPKAEPQTIPRMTFRDAEEIIARDLHGEVIDLNEHIFGKTGGEGEQVITVTFGHTVFKTGRSTILDTPLPNPVSADSMLEWVHSHGSTVRTFVPGQVPAIGIPSDVTSFHRLQYRTIEGGHTINVNVELPGNDVEPSVGPTGNLETRSVDAGSADELELVSTAQSPVESSKDHSSSSELDNNFKLSEERDVDSVAPDLLGEPTADPAADHSSLEGKPDAMEYVPLPVEITAGTESTFELMLPESTMDVCIQVSKTSPMAKSMVPEALDIYLDGLSKFFTTDIEMPQPDPPQYLSFDGQHYILIKNTSARSGISNFPDLPRECTVTNESSLDLENNIRTVFTQVTYCSDKGEKDWDGFIEACDALASKPYERSTELRVSPT